MKSSSRVVIPMRPFASAPLGVIERSRGALDVARVRDRDDDIFVGDQIFERDFHLLVDDLRCAVRRRMSSATSLQLFDDHSFQDLFAGQDFLEAGDELQDLFVFGDDFLALQPGQALQAHVEDRLRLFRAELELGHQALFGDGRFLGSADQGDDLRPACRARA